MSTSEVLQRVIAKLDQAGVGYMLTGSFASAYYGVPRSTQDLDLVIEASAEQLQTFVRSLPTEEYYADLDAALEARKHESLFNVIDLSTGWKIDLIIRKSRPFSMQEFHRRQQVKLQSLLLFVTTAEDIVIAKLEWSKFAQSQRQIEDVAAILRVRGALLDRGYLMKWVRELNLETQWLDAQRAGGI